MKVLVTGGSGLVGTAFKNHSHSEIEWIVLDGPGHGGVDLCNREQTFEYFSSISVDAVVHTAARVGGISDNINNPMDFFSKNSMINTNTLDAASRFGIKKCISFLSTCIYPDNCGYPLRESDIHNGQPHTSNFAYAYTKRMLDVQSRAIHQEKDYQYFCVCPNNLYGLNDNFDLENSHVIPAMIRKFYEASVESKKVRLWGTGKAMREFTFANDLPDVIAFLLKLDHPLGGVINIGNTIEETSVSRLSSMIGRIIGNTSDVIWNTSKPDGQIRKPSSSEKLKVLGYNVNSFTRIEDGLEKTIDWFMKNYPEVRGVT